MIRSTPAEPGRVYMSKKQVPIPPGVRTPCRENPRPYFKDDVTEGQAARLCSGCPVRTACLRTALINGETTGVWGGTNAKQRKAILRRSDR